jgi:hypothetical protein
MGSLQLKRRKIVGRSGASSLSGETVVELGGRFAASRRSTGLTPARARRISPHAARSRPYVGRTAPCRKPSGRETPASRAPAMRRNRRARRRARGIRGTRRKGFLPLLLRIENRRPRAATGLRGSDAATIMPQERCAGIVMIR